MSTIRTQLNHNLELNIESAGYHVIRCNNMTSFEVLDYPEACLKTT